MKTKNNQRLQILSRDMFDLFIHGFNNKIIIIIKGEGEGKGNSECQYNLQSTPFFLLLGLFHSICYLSGH